MLQQNAKTELLAVTNRPHLGELRREEICIPFFTSDRSWLTQSRGDRERAKSDGGE